MVSNWAFLLKHFENVEMKLHHWRLDRYMIEDFYDDRPCVCFFVSGWLCSVCRCVDRHVRVYAVSNKGTVAVLPECVTGTLKPQGRGGWLLRAWNIELQYMRASSSPPAPTVMTPLSAQGNYNGWESETLEAQKVFYRNRTIKSNFLFHL